jgi:hypothetical protein
VYGAAANLALHERGDFRGHQHTRTHQAASRPLAGLVIIERRILAIS